METSKFRYFWILGWLTALAILVGCGENESGSGSTSSDGRRRVAQTQFAREVELQFYDPLNKRVVSSPIAKLSEKEIEALQELKSLRAQSPSLRIQQQISLDGISESFPVWALQDDPSGYQVTFCPRTLDDRVFGGVSTEMTQGGLAEGSLTYRIEMPPAAVHPDMGTLVRVGLADDVAIQGDVIEIKFEKVNEKQLLRINGEVIEDWDIVDYSSWFYDPIIKSTTPGLYRVSVTMEIPGSPVWERSQTFLQRRLSFANDFPEYSEEPEGPVEIQNAFSWSDGAPTDGASWSVRNNESGERKFGSGNEILAVWEPEERVLAKTEEDSRFEKVPFTVKASATSYNILGSPFPYEISSDFDLAGQVRLRIIDAQVEPDPPFEEPGSSVTLTARAVTIATDLDPSSLEWKVDLKDTDGAVVIEDLATGTGPDIIAEWDGTVDGVAVEEPTSYLFAIEVWGCEGGVVVGAKRLPGSVRGQVVGAPSECLQAEKEVAFGKPSPRLEILGSGNAVLAIGLDEPAENNSDKKEAYRLFSTVHHMGMGSTVRFRASGLESDAGPLSLSLGSVTTGGVHPDSILLEETSQGSGEYLSQPVTLTEELILSRTEPKKPSGEPIGTLYSMGFISDAIYDVSTIFLEQVIPKYPAERLSLGRYTLAEAYGLAEGISFPDITSLPSQLAVATKSNLQALGFETLSAELSAYGDIPPLKAYLKVASPAHHVLFNFHGNYRDGSLNILDDQFRGGAYFFPIDLQQQYASDADTLLFAACDVLNINDYNDLKQWGTLIDPVTFQDIWTPQNARYSPGLKWYNEFIAKSASNRPAGRPSQVLLGYNGPAPVWFVSDVMSEYARQLDVFQGAANRQQMAWMTANLIVGQRADLGNAAAPPELTLQACAIDKDRYYYIPFEYDRSRQSDLFTRIHQDSIAGIHWVERAKWIQTPEEWRRNIRPNGQGGLGIAEPARRL